MIDAKSVIIIVAAIASLFHQSTWAQGRTGPVVIGETVQLHSKILNESRSLLISKPAGYDGSADRYPVLYLLDGETLFSTPVQWSTFLRMMTACQRCSSLE